MIKLFFDIETLPSAVEHIDRHLEILRKKHPDKTDREIHRETSLEGTFGRICCIDVIKEGPEGIIQREVFSGNEKEILKNFWAAARSVDRFVGHSIWAFDLPFIYKRSLILGIKPRRLNLAHYRNMPIFDTMQEWELWNMGQGRWQTLDTLAKVLGLATSKDEMDGLLVWDYYQEGRIEDIKRYCMKDVELVRRIYYKMAFDDPVTSYITASPKETREKADELV